MDASKASSVPAEAPHATLLKFGYPGTLIHRGEYWALLARPTQPTLGSLVLCTIGDETRLADMPSGAFVEFGTMIAAIEGLLNDIAQAEKINYLMLMMVDPHVHYHIIPRYSEPRSFAGVSYPDRGWPGLPDLTKATQLGEELTSVFKSKWKSHKALSRKGS